MMKVQFREAGFAKETLTAAAVAAVAGPLVVLPSLGIVGTNALGFVAALVALPIASFVTSLLRPAPQKMWQRALAGLGWLAAGVGAFFAIGVTLDELTSWREATFLAAATGGLGAALGAALGMEGHKRNLALGASFGFAAGVVGGFALPIMSRYFVSEGVAPVLSTSAMTSLLGLWVAAGAGLRRVEAQKDEVRVEAEALLTTLAEPARMKVQDLLDAWREMESAVAADDDAGDTAREALRLAKKLVASSLPTARAWQQLHADIHAPRLLGVAEKLADFEKRAAATEDAATRGHLERAIVSLRAQASVVEGLQVGLVRAEAALDAQGALCERLRLAVSQQKVHDHERFAVEVAAVGDQVARFGESGDSLSSAIAEAEALADRRVLADLERAGRRSLFAVEEPIDAPPGPPSSSAGLPSVVELRSTKGSARR